MAITNQIAAFEHYSGSESLGALRDLDAIIMAHYKLGQIHVPSIAKELSVSDENVVKTHVAMAHIEAAHSTIDLDGP